MPLLVGAALAVSVGLFARIVGLDRDRAFYPVVTIVVAAFYILFAAIGGTVEILAVEALAAAVFLLLAVAGFRRSLWIAAGALAGHGIFDLVHGALIANPGVPVWWPPFCLGFDVTAGAYLAWLLGSGRVRAAA